jgi:formate/nitrite transporter
MEINNYLETAKGKINNKTLKTFVLAILAGVFIALAAVLSVVSSISYGNYSAAKLMGALVFPIGLILVILMKTELFTGNSLLVIPLLNKDIKIKELLKNWGVVYLGNLVGSLIIALLISITPLKEVVAASFIKITNTKVSLDLSSSIILGILCNFLVCLAVFLASNAKTICEKVIVIFLPIFTFVALSFEHSVANMTYLSLGYIFDESVTIGKILLNNLLPVTLGNIIGGSLLGMLIYYLKKD